MPDDRPRPAAPSYRTASERAADHSVIDELADDLLPALVAKLGASGLGEIEVREGAWRLRIRRPASAIDRGRRASDGPSRSQPGHAGHGHAPAGFEGHRSAREPRSAAAHSTNGSSPQLTAVGPGPERESESHARSETMPGQAIATSPAVGVYQPRAEARPGTKVRAGDRLGAVDMLGVAQEVVAPVDGLVGQSLVEPGQAVEYGQELVVIELVGAPAGEG
jgi:biotin carboxyl carrier protein